MNERLNRVELKNLAKEVLSDNYARTLGAILIIVAVAGALSQPIGIITAPIALIDTQPSILLFIAYLIATVLILIVESLAIHPLNIGLSRFLIRSAYGEKKFDNVFDGFKNNYFGRVIVVLAYELVISGPLLLLQCMTILGDPADLAFFFVVFMLIIVATIFCVLVSYMLYFVMYIIAENKDIGFKEAFKASIELTNGYKWELFVLELSFFGWYLLGALACGIGVIFVLPYSEQTKAQAYLKLRDMAVKEGRVSKEMFGDAYFIESYINVEQTPENDITE